MTKYIFVTGGVVSGLGKGITAASLGRLLKMRGYKVASQKLDPYINIDPGTMSPFQHGEVFVTEDGAETDLDLGHYERFIDENLNKYSNLTTGKVYWNVLNKERSGERMSGRRVCEKCGASYHIINKKSKVEGVCDLCGGKTVIRKDDQPATVLDRLKAYHEQTEPLVDFYRTRGKLAEIKFCPSIEETTAEVMKALEA